MALLHEPDVVKFRHDYYELLTRLIAAEPDAALLAALGEGIEERALGATQVHRRMGEGWRAMAAHLGGAALEGLADEYTRIFLGPYGTVLQPYESYYLSGRLYAEPLAEVRGFLAREGLEPTGESRGEPEDTLAFELGVMLRLVARQRAGGDAEPGAFIEAQREFLARHLLVWGPAVSADIEHNPAAAFYKGVAQVLGGFMEVERDFFSEEGGLEVESLEAARRRHNSPAFKGPVFDPEALAPGDPRREKKGD
jgi:TorA maturation chaperone TorD